MYEQELGGMEKSCEKERVGDKGREELKRVEKRWTKVEESSEELGRAEKNLKKVKKSSGEPRKAGKSWQEVRRADKN